jgi:hypothetical protein
MEPASLLRDRTFIVENMNLFQSLVTELRVDRVSLYQMCMGEQMKTNVPTLDQPSVMMKMWMNQFLSGNLRRK